MNRPETVAGSFDGPLFVVGMPRSGTKLLRALLDAHPRIGLPVAESQFLPLLIARRADMGALDTPARFAGFYEKMLRLPYFVYMREQGPGVIDRETWFGSCRDYTAAGIYEALIRHDARAPVGSGIVWGDKCPSYLIHAPLLKRTFPAARFIHIVRDARDYALSCQNTWGKNPQRAAQRWADRIRLFERDSAAFADSMTVLRYEDLLADPEQALRGICAFLGLDFDARMLVLQRPSENLGDTRGKKHIVADNIGKYREQFSKRVVRRIESVTADVLERYGYAHEHTGATRRVGRFSLAVYRLLDGFNLLRFEARQRPLMEAIGFQWRLFRTSGNRQWKGSRGTRGE